MLIPHRRTLPTTDLDGVTINNAANPVSHRAACGKLLLDLLNSRFGGDVASFRRWCRSNLDSSLHSVTRYILLYQNRELLTGQGIVALSDAYRILGVDRDGISLADLDLI